MAGDVGDALRRLIACRVYHVCKHCFIHEDDTFLRPANRREPLPVCERSERSVDQRKPNNRPTNGHRVSDGAMPAGALFLSTAKPPPSPSAGGVTERSIAGRLGGRRFVRQRHDVASIIDSVFGVSPRLALKFHFHLVRTKIKQQLVTTVFRQ